MRKWNDSPGGDAATARLAVDPLAWYIGTDRMPLEDMRKVCGATQRQLTTIARRLEKCAGHSHDEAVAAVLDYLRG